MFQTLFPPLPEFEGRQVVTLHNQRDFLFFRRHRYVDISHTHTGVASHSLHRYAFRSIEKAALQEIGPRFTLKLRSLKKGVPAVKNLGAPPPPLVLASDVPENEETTAPTESGQPPKGEEYLWQWKVFIGFLLLTTSVFSLASTAARVGGFATNFFLVNLDAADIPVPLCATSGGYVMPHCLHIFAYASTRT